MSALILLLLALGTDDLCKEQANWALILLKDIQAGWSVNVMPSDERTLKLVREHQGTKEELYWKVLYDCKGAT